MKIIKIRFCSECPCNAYGYFDNEVYVFKCNATNNYYRSENITVDNGYYEIPIQKDCPLQSKEDFIKGEIEKSNKKIFDFMESAGFKKVLNKSKGDI